MNLFVFEFVSGGGLGGAPLPPDLAREGDMMLHALLEDLAALPGVCVRTSRDPRLPPLSNVRTIAPGPGEDAVALYARGAATADAAWPIAPETGGALEALARRTLDVGKILIGCSPAAIRLTTSKRATAHWLHAAHVPTVPTFGNGDALPPLPGAWIVKPDDGAGCDGTVVVSDWSAVRDRLAAESRHLIAQPWIDGPALSLSLLCGGGRAALLSCNRQHTRIAAGRVTLEAISVNALADRSGQLARLAGRIAAAVPGLWGYVGVDLVLSAQGPMVLEINPRLTTSYCGLRSALGINAAGMVLDLLQTGTGVASHRPEGGTTALIPLAVDHGD